MHSCDFYTFIKHSHTHAYTLALALALCEVMLHLVCVSVCILSYIHIARGLVSANYVEWFHLVLALALSVCVWIGGVNVFLYLWHSSIFHIEHKKTIKIYRNRTSQVHSPTQMISCLFFFFFLWFCSWRMLCVFQAFKQAFTHTYTHTYTPTRAQKKTTRKKDMYIRREFNDKYIHSTHLLFQ